MKSAWQQGERRDRTHGLMFHHFLGGCHGPGQGAIDAKTFEACLDWAGGERILGAEEWLWKARRDRLEDWDLCLTLDDGLACQFEIALPVLRARGLTAFWFVYTGPYRGEPGMLEVYRIFRTRHFGSVEEFYSEFYKALDLVEQRARTEEGLRGFDPAPWRAAYPYYSVEDLRFRYVRDSILSADEYAAVMNAMMAARGVAAGELAQGLWMGEGELARLAAEGHEVGLHSHSHPTVLAQLSGEEQRNEYRENFRILREITGRDPVSVAHPCNSYDERTLQILRDLGMATGFCANMEGPGGALEIPRQDHANVMRMMKEGE